jgi:Gluconate 2-dehydrogenase subunit 3
MKATRRGFIKTLAVGLLGKDLITNLPETVFASPQVDDNGFEIEKGYVVFNAETQKSMEALAEALVPGSKELGIRKMFMDYIKKDPGLPFAGFLDAGFWSLHTASKQRFKKPFYKLESKEEREAVVKYMVAQNGKFVDIFKEIVIQLYYSSPQVWKKLSYHGPPQPVGFMDYSLPPK